ncbi:mechanosensitive ion channel family protein [Desulfovirgula thermocuniculi]|uniref:mechanosensitive ion channel family protein n=1 Tax=Desulfovirgula thermocuniculi TaxID=348842 RepID=UPI0003F97363|nr:mechanosensitive ion channel family protein [Desulfovirgula thermocuniculi]
MAGFWEKWTARAGEFLRAQWETVNWTAVLAAGLKVVVVILLAWLLLRLGDAAIDRFFARRGGENRRVNTLRTLLKSGLHYTAYFMIIVTALSLCGVKVEAILAGAGIVGLAVGFGAQSLVRDVITGFFILLEDQFAVGDYITAAGVSGTVEEMGLRVTKLRDFGGQLHIIPNGQISMVTNYSKGNTRVLVEVGVAYEESLERVLGVLKKVCEEASGELSEVIVEGPKVLGVEGFGPHDVVIRIVAYTKPLHHWYVERELRRRIKEAFDREGIEIPYPRRVVITTVGREG